MTDTEIIAIMAKEGKAPFEYARMWIEERERKKLLETLTLGEYLKMTPEQQEFVTKWAVG